MHVKHLFLLILLAIGHHGICQYTSIDREIETIDSLIEYNRFDKAEKKTDSLYRILKEKYTGGKYTEQRLRTRLLKGIIIDNQNKHRNALPIFYEVLDDAKNKGLHKLTCISNIRISLNLEKANNYYLAHKYLNDAFALCKKYNFKELYSNIYIRYASIHRFLGNINAVDINKELAKLTVPKNHFTIDSAFYYSYKTIYYATKYHNESDLTGAYMTLGILYNNKNEPDKAIACYEKVIPYMRKVNDFESIGCMYNNMAIARLRQKNEKAALVYSDSAYKYYPQTSLYYKYMSPKVRAVVFEKLEQLDSAFYYLKIGDKNHIDLYEQQEVSNTKKLEEQYENDKKEAQIKSKNQLMIFILSLLLVIVVFAVLLIRKNRRINAQNNIISKQVEELVKTLGQKQVLLSELQHRVKNNLQHVISILEIQKESVDFNNIDELIRGNQNRIHSMALLHKKLNVSENVTDVNLCKYLTELSELVKDSYDSNKKKILLEMVCEIESFSIEKALPVGLIIVELLSNSMKHAFKNRNIGIINVKITKEESSQKHKIYYADNGIGFDFHATSEKGLGMEITKGLIDQLNGEATAKNQNGFELTILF